jgi:hypothetical protein
VAYDTGTNIGIGTTNPLYTLEVVGTAKVPTPFTVGSTSVTTTGTQLNYINAATGTTGTTSSNIVFSLSPTLTGNVGISTANVTRLVSSSINAATGEELTFTDSSGTATLTTLKSMRNVWISASGQSEGNLTLADGTNWAAQYSFIDSIRVLTSSTSWDLWLCETSAFNTALISSRHLADDISGNYDIDVHREYNSDSNNAYLIYTDNSGANTADFYISGEGRRH